MDATAMPRRPNSLAIQDRLHPAAFYVRSRRGNPDDGAAGCIRRPNVKLPLPEDRTSARSPPHSPEGSAHPATDPATLLETQFEVFDRSVLHQTTNSCPLALGAHTDHS